MNKRMKNVLTAVISFSLLVSAGAGIFSAEALSADAAEDTTLFLPSSYEQYLPLQNPSDAAMNERYIAVADGNLLYLYDREEKVYSEYEHIGSDNSERGISALAFAEDGKLYFADHNSQLYLYDVKTNTAEIQSDVPSSNFVVAGSTLYTAAVASKTTIYAIPIPEDNASLSLKQATEVCTIDTTKTPAMTYSNGKLYCAINDIVYQFVYDGATKSYNMTKNLLAGNDTEITDLTSLYMFKDQLYFTVSGSRTDSERYGFYRAELGVSAVKLLSGSGFNNLLSYGDSLYCIKGATIREISIGETSAEYTGYEIAAASDNFNRISDAGDTVTAGNLVVIADCGNERVLVYNKSYESYSSIALDGRPTAVATDGELIAVGVGSSVRLYRYGESSPYQTRTIENGTAVTGVAFVFGVCYYITDHSYGIVRDGVPETTRPNSPATLTSDIWGNLYVADVALRVTKFSEEQFIDQSSAGEDMGFTLPSDYTALRADFDGNLYYISDSYLYRNGVPYSAIGGSDLVYRGKNAENASPVSFALGFDDGGVYFQYGDYMLRRVLDIPTLSTIPAENAQTLFQTLNLSETGTPYVVVDAGATCIQIDLHGADENEYFTYLGYSRSDGGQGVALMRTGKYTVVALYSEKNREYSVGLYLTEDCTSASASLTQVNEVRYASSEISLSYFPCLNDALTIKRLPRATQLTVYETITDGSYTFAYVSYESDNGVVYGYLLSSYLVEESPVAEQSDNFMLGYLKANEKGIEFRSGENRITVTERTQIKIYDTGDGYYLASFTAGDGLVYTAQVTDGMIEEGNTEALRTSLIVILCVIAVGILAAYVILVPRRKKK